MKQLLALLFLLQLAPETGSISGRVVRAGSSLQLDNARVELSGGSIRTTVQRTDGQGGFAFSGLPAGTYHLLVTSDGYVRQEFAKRAAIIVQAGKEHKPLLFELQPAPTIAGRVVNESGSAIGGIVVSALKGSYNAVGSRTYAVVESTPTDDRGDYRLYWLDPGEYVVSAAFVPLNRQTPDGPVARVMYASTFFPAASDLRDAQRLILRAGQESPANFRLIRATGRTIRGTVTTLANEPISMVNVTVALAGDSAQTAQYVAKSQARGEFQILDVPPGDYVVSAQTVIRKERVATAVHLIINDRDENNVGLILSPGVRVSGRISVDGDKTLEFKSTRMRLNSIDPALESIVTSIQNADGQFAADGVQRGSYMVQVEALPPDTYVKQIRSGAIDLRMYAFDIRWESPPALDVLLGSDGARIAGVALDSMGKSFAGAEVILVPNADRRMLPDQYRVAASNEDGMFELTGVPPGDYQLLAFENIEERAWLNAAFIEKYLESGLAVRVAASGNATVQIPVIPEG